MTHIKTLSAGSILSVVVLALKYAAYALTATVALLSDAIESIVTRVWEGGGQARGPDIFWT
jgi:divalent metal cation (Fe/Co/Zn/Cd) transporter